MIHPSNLPRLPEGTSAAVRAFAMAIAGVLEAIGRAFNVNPAPPVPGRVIRAYVHRVRERFMRLMARLEAGKPARTRRPRAVSEDNVPEERKEPKERATPRIRLPRRKAWLAGEIGWWGRGFASQVRHALEEPGMAARIAGDAQAQRMLRPLCRMLGIEVACVPQLPRRARPKPEPKPKAAKAKRLPRRERLAMLRYPNTEGQPKRLLPRKLPRD